MSNRGLILEEIITFESIGRIAKLLDQLCDGLKTLGVLWIMKAFPQIFVQLFTYTEAVSATDVLETLNIPTHLDSRDVITVCHLKRFITEASEEGK